ncbi:MAG: multiubiquitin domain-containing protein [Hyphomonadaceae bacterium]|nr:multiubiquitin domain-containing protein [Hyphomonadaceae bacterium]
MAEGNSGSGDPHHVAGGNHPPAGSTERHLDEVRVHIDQKAYRSPNPTTGAALYALGHVKDHYVLYREVDGNREDEPVSREATRVHLRQDEHFHSGKAHDRHFKIVVNLEEKVVDKKELTFREVVKLAFPQTDGSEWVYTVTYKKAAGPNREGTLTEGETVEVKNGTIFNVTRTYKS